MKKKIILGFDVGTSSLKTTILDSENGKVIKNQRYDYLVKELVPGVLPVRVYEDAVLLTLNNLSKEYCIIGIGVSTQMYSLCKDTKDGRMVYQWNSLWEKSEWIEDFIKKEAIKSGCPADTLYPSYKLYSMGFSDRKVFVPYGLKEHLIHYLTGELITDYSTASASGLFDVHKRKWNKEYIEALGYSMADMPIVKRHNEAAGLVKNGLFDNNGENTVVVPGLGDGISASFACSSASNVCSNIGTSMAVRTFTDQINDKFDSSLWVYAVDEKKYVLGGISSNSCSVLNWAKDIGWHEEMELTDTAKIMFFPWLHGERTPFWSSDLRGMMVGITINSNKQMIDSAVIKGVGFTLCRIVEEMQPYLEKDSVLITAGGGAHSKAILEVISGVISIKIGILNEYDYLASFGAVMSVAEELGVKIEECIYLDKIIEPTCKFKKEYEKWREMGEHFAKLYNELPKE